MKLQPRHFNKPSSITAATSPAGPGATFTDLRKRSRTSKALRCSTGSNPNLRPLPACQSIHGGGERSKTTFAHRRSLESWNRAPLAGDEPEELFAVARARTIHEPVEEVAAALSTLGKGTPWRCGPESQRRSSRSAIRELFPETVPTQPHAEEELSRARRSCSRRRDRPRNPGETGRHRASGGKRRAAMKAEEVVRRLRLAPHPEGGFYREIYRAPGRGADGRHLDLFPAGGRAVALAPGRCAGNLGLARRRAAGAGDGEPAA